jgi:hypothetical protein
MEKFSFVNFFTFITLQLSFSLVVTLVDETFLFKVVLYLKPWTITRNITILIHFIENSFVACNKKHDNGSKEIKAYQLERQED